MIRLLAGDRVGPGAEQTRSDVDEWSRLVEVGVVGLGNCDAASALMLAGVTLVQPRAREPLAVPAPVGNDGR